MCTGGENSLILIKLYILENSVFVAIKVRPNIHMQPHMLHCITVIAAWSNDLSRLNMISFKQPKTLF